WQLTEHAPATSMLLRMFRQALLRASAGEASLFRCSRVDCAVGGKHAFSAADLVHVLCDNAVQLASRLLPSNSADSSANKALPASDAKGQPPGQHATAQPAQPKPAPQLPPPLTGVVMLSPVGVPDSVLHPVAAPAKPEQPQVQPSEE